MVFYLQKKQAVSHYRSLFLKCSGSLFRLLQRSTTKLDWRRRVHMALDVVSAFLSNGRMWILPQITYYFLVQKEMQLMTGKTENYSWIVVCRDIDCVQNVKCETPDFVFVANGHV